MSRMAMGYKREHQHNRESADSTARLEIRAFSFVSLGVGAYHDNEII